MYHGAKGGTMFVVEASIAIGGCKLFLLFFFFLPLFDDNNGSQYVLVENIRILFLNLDDGTTQPVNEAESPPTVITPNPVL